MNRSTPLWLALGLALSPTLAAAQSAPTVHRLPFGAADAALRLTVANTAEIAARPMQVTVMDKPAWLMLAPDTVALTDLAAGAEIEARFSLSLSRTAPVGESGTVTFAVLAADGQRWLKTIEFAAAAPDRVRLYPAAPNPFNPATTIRYELPTAAQVRLSVYSVLGQEVRRLVSADEVAGAHQAVFRAEGLASGPYFYRLTVTPPGGAATVEIGRMLLMK